MTNVIDFNERAERLSRERRERWEKEQKIEEANKEYTRLINFFLSNFSKQPKEVQEEIFEAIKAGDAKRYLEITEPILQANAHREAMKELSKHL